MGIPARSNPPPGEQKSFCISITRSAVLLRSIVSGSGLASTVVTEFFDSVAVNKTAHFFASIVKSPPLTLATKELFF